MRVETHPLTHAEVKEILGTKLSHESFHRIWRLVRRFGTQFSTHLTAMFIIAVDRGSKTVSELLSDIELRWEIDYCSQDGLDEIDDQCGICHALEMFAQMSRKHLHVIPFTCRLRDGERWLQNQLQASESTA